MKFSRLAGAALAGVSGLALSTAAFGQTAVQELVVTAPTPLSGQANVATIAAPVQTVTGAQLDRSHALDLSAYMNRALGSVYINDIQNNPLQPDINYRGYTASPLLGTPQGVSVYLDGVRMNQPFGDVVSWDLIPRAAIASVTLVPGSNPLFGLNTLGGALSIRTKDGRSAPGVAVQGGYGSDGRWQAEVEAGGEGGGGFNWFVTANKFEEDGWRDDSPSDSAQAFAKIGWSDGRTDLALTGAYAYNDLTGNGMQELQLLSRDYSSIYTKPDNTKNQSAFLNFTATHRLSDALTFSGNAYYRTIDAKTFNGDINDESLEETVYQPSAGERAALAAAGFTGVPTAGESAVNTPFPRFRCIANIILNAEPGEKCNGLLNRTKSEQRDAGFSGQFTYTGDLAGRANQFTVGAAYSANRAHFTQSSQYGYLSPDRGIVAYPGPGAFADGTQDSEDPDDARVNLTGRTTTWSLYAANTFELAPGLNLTLSGRYDSSSVKNRDALIPTGPGTLTGDHEFNRFNPAVGLTWAASESLGAYIGYNEGSRAPSAIELGCADPANPCKLPNAMAGDPPLNQVVTKTMEAGLRGSFSEGITWNAGVFRADNHDDIMFVADDTAGFGYFKNFGKTRREGFEAGIAGRSGPFSFNANYTYLKATYRSEEEVAGESNSSNDGDGPGFGGDIEIEPGHRIPLIPSHIFKAGVRWDVRSNLSVDWDVIYVGGSYARGNENNEHEADGVYYLGPGKTESYAVFNLGAEYRPVPALKLFVQVNNLFDKSYATASQLGPAGFTADGAFVSRPFATPVIDGERPLRHSTFYGAGAPRSFWIGLLYAFR